MPKISDLMQGKKPGEIKIRKTFWQNKWFFIPYHLSKDFIWSGVDERDVPISFDGETDYWELHTELKPKVVWHEYLCTPTKEGVESVGYFEYRTENDKPEKNKYWNHTKTGRTVEVEGD